MIQIGKRIKGLRQEKHWSQSDVAARLGISVAAFSKIETDVTDVSLSRVADIADIFGITLAELLLPDEMHTSKYSDDLKTAKETIEAQINKIVILQEYIITLYEEIHKTKTRLLTDN